LEGYRVAQVILSPPRQSLHERIAHRTEAMFAAGLVQELRELLNKGVPPTAKAFESIGYKECLRFLQGGITEEEAKEQVTIATRQYAKRQETWFRKHENCLRISGFGDSNTALDATMRYLAMTLLAKAKKITKLFEFAFV
jgi:tRNA dimethylallyltransferase